MSGERQTTPTVPEAAATVAAHDAILSACREAWSAGYQTAVNALREMEDEFGSDDMKAAIAVLADSLEAVKPR